MKILLTTLNSKYIHSNLALKYLRAAAGTEGLNADIEVREFTINNESGYIYTEILRGGYDLVCFSCYIWNIEQTLALASDLKKALPQLQILLGGPEVSYDSRNLMEKNPCVDWILRGEGEESFRRLCFVLSRNEPCQALSSVSGLTWRNGQEIAETPRGALLTVDQIPFPYAAHLPEPDKVVYYETSRGCPYRCSYCLSSLEKGIRALPLKRVKEELNFFLDLGVKQVKLIDRTFNYDGARAAEIWRYLIQSDRGKTNFHFEICANLLEEDHLKLLAEARPGLFQFEIGVQSTNPKTLDAIRRAGSKENLKRIAELAALKNCHTHVDLIAGLPFEDYSTFGRSFNQVYALGADHVQLGFLKLLKGTAMREEACRHGYVFRDRPPYEVISNRYISAKELARLKMIEHVLELYAGRGGFDRALRLVMEKTRWTPFSFYQRFSEFFYQAGYQHRSHKKEDLYRIFRRFTQTLAADFSGIDRETEEALAADLCETMNFDAVKKFHKKGWEI